MLKTLTVCLLIKIKLLEKQLMQLVKLITFTNQSEIMIDQLANEDQQMYVDDNLSDHQTA